MYIRWNLRWHAKLDKIAVAKNSFIIRQNMLYLHSNEIKEAAMKHIKTLNTRNLKESMKKGGCGECQTSCQSACKTSCTVGNQSCENNN
mgnify:CR=1 FL=1